MIWYVCSWYLCVSYYLFASTPPEYVTVTFYTNIKHQKLVSSGCTVRWWWYTSGIGQIAWKIAQVPQKPKYQAQLLSPCEHLHLCLTFPLTCRLEGELEGKTCSRFFFSLVVVQWVYFNLSVLEINGNASRWTFWWSTKKQIEFALSLPRRVYKKEW